MRILKIFMRGKTYHGSLFSFYQSKNSMIILYISENNRVVFGGSSGDEDVCVFGSFRTEDCKIQKGGKKTPFEAIETIEFLKELTWNLSNTNFHNHIFKTLTYTFL